MRILVTGAFGLLGCSLSNILSLNHEVFKTGRRISNNTLGLELDIQNIIHMKDIIKSIMPEVIINLAAMTNVDQCEKNPHLAKEINITGVQNIVNSFSGKIIHLSTDYVFSGIKGPYTEEDKPEPISVYGSTKLISEKIILENSDNLVLRGNVLYGIAENTKASFLSWVVKSLLNNDKIKIVNDQFNNPTWTESMAEVIQLSLNNNICGLYHWGDEEYLSRFDFGIKIAEKYNLDKSLIEKTTTNELNQIASRPLKGGLRQEKLKDALKISPPKIKECLDQIMMEDLK